MDIQTLLIVEDEPEIRVILAETLSSQFSLNILEAADGQEAFDILKSKQVDLVITDLAMPVMNGFEFLRRLKVSGIKVPTIVLTGHGDKAVASQLKAYGVIEFINKPWQRDQLVDAVKGILIPKSDQKVG